jgi:hypothetical protein
MRILVTVVAIAAAIAGTVPAFAVSDFTAWKTFEDTTPRGTHFCGVMSESSKKNIGQNVAVKASNGGLVVDLYYDKWLRRQGSTIKVAFDFVDNQPLTLSAYADNHILDIQIPQQYFATFLLQVAQRPAMQIIFPDDPSAGTWVIQNRGAKGAIQKMTACLGRGSNAAH